MTTLFPGALDNFTTPAGSEKLGLSTPTHPQLHTDVNDAIEALESVVGITGSTDPASIEKRLTDVINESATAAADAISALAAAALVASDLSTLDSSLGTAAYTDSGDYALVANGVTNGDAHDHNGGDGAQIAYANLSGLPSLGTAAAANTGDFEPAGAVSTHNAIATAHGISSFGATLVDDDDDATARATLGVPAGSGTSTGTNTGDATTATHGALINSATDKAPPIDADAFSIWDSVSGLLQKVTWANLKSELRAWLFGTATPLAKVHVVDTAEQLRLGYDTGNYTGFTVGSGGSLTISSSGSSEVFAARSDGNFGIGSYGSATAKLKVDYTTSSTSASIFAVSSALNYGAGSSSNQTNTVYGQYFNVQTDATYSGNVTNKMYGSKGVMNHYGSGTLTNVLGFAAQVNNRNAGVITNLRTISAEAANNLGAGSVTNNYGVYIYDHSGVGTSVNYNLYSAGSSSKNIFEGDVTINTKLSVGAGNSPSAKIHAISTTEQLRLGYDSSNYASFTVNSSGTMTISSPLVLSPAASTTPPNNNQLVIERTSNTQLTFKLKGSDGTVRSASLTLS